MAAVTSASRWRDIAEFRQPAVDWYLAGDNQRSGIVAVLDDLLARVDLLILDDWGPAAREHVNLTGDYVWGTL
jgi:hypothetical protein